MAQEKTTPTPLKSVPAITPSTSSASSTSAQTPNAASSAVSGTEKKATAAAKKPATKATAKKTAKKSVKKKTAAKKAVKKTAAKSAVKPAAKKTTKTVKKAVKKSVKKATSPKAKAAVKSAVKSVGGASNISQFKPFNPNTMNMEKVMSQGKNQFDKLAQDASVASRENIEAVIKSSTIFAKGLEEVMRLSMSMAQDAAERQSRFMKDVLSVKTLNEFTEVQNRIAQANFEDFMSGATKITEISTKILNDSIEPINNQFTKSIKKATDKMAA
ncbi:MAG: phasin family protein [Alphaproteobacteria bacterium]